MITAVIWLGIGLVITILYLSATVANLRQLEKQLIAIDKEQHEQNKEILELMKHRLATDERLLQHIEILQYLCDRDPMLSRTRVPYIGPIGEA